MNLLQVIQFILYLHARSGVGHEQIISGPLKNSGILMPGHVVRAIISSLYHHPPSVRNGPIYEIEWAMRGFQIIMDDSATGVQSRHISMRLKERNYYWDDDFVTMIILADWLLVNSWTHALKGMIPSLSFLLGDATVVPLRIPSNTFLKI